MTNNQVFPPRGSCLWSDDRRAPYRFCGAPAERAGECWCPEHRGRVYQAVSLKPIRPTREANVIRRSS